MKKVFYSILFIAAAVSFVILDYQYKISVGWENAIYMVLCAAFMFILGFPRNSEPCKKSIKIASAVIAFLIMAGKCYRFYEAVCCCIYFEQIVYLSVKVRVLVAIMSFALSLIAFFGCYFSACNVLRWFDLSPKTEIETDNKLNNLSKMMLIFSVVILVVLSIDVFCEHFLTLFRGHDIRFHVNRVACIAVELKENGIFSLPHRIYSSALGGYGYANPMFYGDIFLLIPSVLVCLGLSDMVAYKLFTIMLVVAAFISMFWVTKKLTKDVNRGIVAAYIYTFSSYFATDVITRCALGESIAFVILPIVFYAWHTFCHDKKPRILLLAVSMAALILSHIITSVLTAIVLGVSFLIHLRKNKRLIIDVIKAAAICVGLTAFFIFPMLEQVASQTFYVTDRVDHLAIRVPDVFYSLLPSNVVNYLVYDVKNLAYEIDRHWSPGFWAILPILAIILLKIEKPSSWSKFLKSQFWLLIASLIFVASPICIFVDTLAGFMQFPWRFLVFTTMAASFLCAQMLSHRPKKIAALLCLIVPLITFSVTVYDSALSIRIGIPYSYDFSSYRIGAGEYLPMTEAKEGDTYFDVVAYMRDRGDLAICDSENTKLQFERTENGGKIHFSENDAEYLAIEAPITYYKGYVCEYNGIKHKPKKSFYGLLSFDIEPSDSSGDVLIYYDGTKIQHASDVITAVSILGVVGFLVLEKIRKFKKIKNEEKAASLT